MKRKASRKSLFESTRSPADRNADKLMFNLLRGRLDSLLKTDAFWRVLHNCPRPMNGPRRPLP